MKKYPTTVHELKCALPWHRNGQSSLKDCAQDLGISSAAVSQAVNGKRVDERVEQWIADAAKLTIEQVRYVTRVVAVFDSVQKHLLVATRRGPLKFLMNPLRYVAGLPIVNPNGHNIDSVKGLRLLITEIESFISEIESGGGDDD